MKLIIKALILTVLMVCVMAEKEPIVVDEVPVEVEKSGEEKFWDVLDEVIFYARNVWKGLFQGTFGVGHVVVAKPDDKCFGEWIPEKMKTLEKFGSTLAHNITGMDFALARAASYDVIDLIFDNQEHCHFSESFIAIYRYCKGEGHCEGSKVLAEMSENAFSLITKVSQVAAIFKEQKWGEMDHEQRGMTVNQIANAFSSLIKDLFGFKPKKSDIEYPAM